MGAKHRMTDLPGRRPRINPRAQRSASTTIVDVASVSILCTASLAVLVVSAVASVNPSGTADVIVHEQLRAPGR